MPKGRGRGGGGGGRGRGGGGGGGGKGGTGNKVTDYFIAVENEKLPTVRWSLSNVGALEGHSRNGGGKTAFMVAIYGNKPKALQMLCDFYARAPALREKGWIDCKDESGRTALMLACSLGHDQCVDVILEIEPKHFRGGGFALLEAKDNAGRDARAHAEAGAKIREKSAGCNACLEVIEDFIRPEEEMTEESMFELEKKMGVDMETGATATVRSKQKKQELRAAEGDFELERAKTREAAAEARKADEAASEAARVVASKTKPVAVWPEVLQVEESIASPDKTIKEITVRREAAGDGTGAGAAAAASSSSSSSDDCPCHGDAANPVDPALWFLADAINRLSLRLPKGVLTALPGPGVARLTAMRELILGNNSLVSLPEEIAQMKDLRVLELQGNELAALPDGVGELKKLQICDLSNNQLASIGALAPIKTLVSLLVDGNKLESFELEAANLTKLSTLSASDNAIPELPEDLGLCAALEQMTLDNTAITELPSSITALKKVKKISMDGCPIADPKIKKKLSEKEGKSLKELWKLIEKMGAKSGKKKPGKKGKK